MLARFHDHALGGTLTISRGWTPGPRAVPVDRYLFIWNRQPDEVRLRIDDRDVAIAADGILCLTPGQVVAAADPMPGVVGIGFDRPFYCVETHDREVSCNGLLFNGALGAPVITLDSREAAGFARLLGVLEEEFHIADATQAEMLRLLLKRFIIKCTRLARRQLLDERAGEPEVELVRRYSALVEKHFRTHHRVRDYADMLHRSPKTLANAFRIAGSRPPLEILLDRIALEARRLLHHTDEPVSGIARTLGFDDAGHFSHFFKRRVGVAPVEFRRAALAERQSAHAGKI